MDWEAEALRVETLARAVIDCGAVAKLIKGVQDGGDIGAIFRFETPHYIGKDLQFDTAERRDRLRELILDELADRYRQAMADRNAAREALIGGAA